MVHLNQYNNTRQLLNALSLRYTGGTTNTAEAIRLARTVMFTPEHGDDPDSPNVLIILTDGKSNVRAETMQEALRARKDGIHIVAVGVGPSVEEEELRSIATDPDANNVFFVQDFVALTGIITPALVAICNGENN